MEAPVEIRYAGVVVARASEVRRQMPQGDMDDIAGMELLLAREARQLEPETME